MARQTIPGEATRQATIDASGGCADTDCDDTATRRISLETLKLATARTTTAQNGADFPNEGTDTDGDNDGFDCADV